MNLKESVPIKMKTIMLSEAMNQSHIRTKTQKYDENNKPKKLKHRRKLKPSKLEEKSVILK
jgi:hypothetical protein